MASRCNNKDDQEKAMGDTLLVDSWITNTHLFTIWLNIITNSNVPKMYYKLQILSQKYKHVYFIRFQGSTIVLYNIAWSTEKVLRCWASRTHAQILLSKHRYFLASTDSKGKMTELTFQQSKGSSSSTLGSRRYIPLNFLLCNVYRSQSLG